MKDRLVPMLAAAAVVACVPPRLVHDHHERLDGSGYPSGRCGEEICFDPRLLAVCDVYDALRSDRVYREAWTHE